jgi:hypothetical protein
MIAEQRSGTPRGQVIVIVAIAMLVLMALGAIVIDLGLSWMLRRHEQNAADPGSIAAAQYIEDGDFVAMQRAACFYAKENGFFAGDSETCVTAQAQGKLEVNWPPIGPLAGNFAGRQEMVQVVIREEHPSFFGRILGRSTATVTTSAVAARERSSSNSNSLVALDPVSCAAGHVSGGGVVTIEPVDNEAGEPFSGGYIHINSSCSPTGAYDNACGSGDGALKKSGASTGRIIAPHAYIHGTCQVAGGTVDTPVTEGAPRIGDPLAQLRGPRQEDYPAGYCPKKVGSMIQYFESQPTDAGCEFSMNGATVTLVPGVYYGGWKFSGNNVTVKLEPGIFILAGGGISVAGSATVAAEEIAGEDGSQPARVLLFSTDNTTDPTCSSSIDRCRQGEINFVGQSGFRVQGLDSGPWRGLLLWQDGEGSNPAAPLKIGGNGALDIGGTVYAPKANVKLQGNSAGTGVAAIQVISWTWEIHGNANLKMPYDPSQLYHITQQGLVH